MGSVCSNTDMSPVLRNKAVLVAVDVTAHMPIASKARCEGSCTVSVSKQATKLGLLYNCISVCCYAWIGHAFQTRHS